MKASHWNQIEFQPDDPTTVVWNRFPPDVVHCNIFLLKKNLFRNMNIIENVNPSNLEAGQNLNLIHSQCSGLAFWLVAKLYSQCSEHTGSSHIHGRKELQSRETTVSQTRHRLSELSGYFGVYCTNWPLICSCMHFKMTTVLWAGLLGWYEHGLKHCGILLKHLKGFAQILDCHIVVS